VAPSAVCSRLVGGFIVWPVAAFYAVSVYLFGLSSFRRSVGLVVRRFVACGLFFNEYGAGVAASDLVLVFL